MFRYSIVLLSAVLVISNVEFIQAGKFGGGGSRSAGGYSRGGGGRHSYPSSGCLSGGGGRSHSYPSSGGLSGGDGGSHSYPSSGGLRGHGGGGSHTYPSSGGNEYPSQGNYPNSGWGLCGANSHVYIPHRGTGGGTTNVYHHYHYNPPQQIQYASHGGVPQSYPVYRGTPPLYVYRYKDSGSKYSNLLTGLALLNLGALAGGGTGYGISSHHSSSNNNYNYKPQPGEVCIFGIKKDNGDFEETSIDCQLISSYIYADQRAQQQNQISVTTTTMTNQTGVTNHTLDAFVLSSTGTLVVSQDAGNATIGTPGTVTTVTNTTVVNAIEVNGAPIQVTPEMQ